MQLTVGAFERLVPAYHRKYETDPDSLLHLLQVLLGFSVLVGTSAWVDLLVS